MIVLTLKYLNGNKSFTNKIQSDSFGFIYNEDKEQDGISEWFNFKGLTYVAK